MKKKNPYKLVFHALNFVEVSSDWCLVRTSNPEGMKIPGVRFSLFDVFFVSFLSFEREKKNIYYLKCKKQVFKPLRNRI